MKIYEKFEKRGRFFFYCNDDKIIQDQMNNNSRYFEQCLPTLVLVLHTQHAHSKLCEPPCHMPSNSHTTEFFLQLKVFCSCRRFSYGKTDL